VPSSLVRAPTTFRQHGDEFGYPLVRVGQVGVGPDHDLAPGLLGADPAHGARAAVAREVDHPQVREIRLRAAQPGQRLVGRAVVDGEQLVADPALVHGGADPLDFEQHVLFLVEAGQHDGGVRDLLARECAHDQRGY
jgi:hypothetical protein